MPDFKCVACRTRTRRVGDAADFIGDLCPSCGSPHELVTELTEVIGFRSVTLADRPVDDPAPLGDFASRRNALYAQRVRDAIDSERWGTTAAPRSSRSRCRHRTGASGPTPEYPARGA